MHVAIASRSSGTPLVATLVLVLASLPSFAGGHTLLEPLPSATRAGGCGDADREA